MSTAFFAIPAKIVERVSKSTVWDDRKNLTPEPQLTKCHCFAVRGDDGHLRVFHNIVPYDGCLAVLAPSKRLEAIEIPCHGLRYDFADASRRHPSGTAGRTPGPRALGGRDGDLVEVRSEERLGVLFINLDRSASGIDDWLEPWRTLVAGDYAIDRLVPARNSRGKPLIERRTGPFQLEDLPGKPRRSISSMKASHTNSTGNRRKFRGWVRTENPGSNSQWRALSWPLPIRGALWRDLRSDPPVDGWSRCFGAARMGLLHDSLSQYQHPASRRVPARRNTGTCGSKRRKPSRTRNSRKRSGSSRNCSMSSRERTG